MNIKEKKKEKRSSTVGGIKWAQQGNPYRKKGKFSSRDDADVYTTGEAKPRPGAKSGKGSMSSGDIEQDWRKCGRGDKLVGRAGQYCRDGEPDMNEEQMDLRTIVEQEIRLALTRIFERMNLRQEVML